MIGGMGSAVTPDLSKGGEIDGDLVITGDFKVEGAGSFAYDEIVDGSLNVNISSNAIGLLVNATDGNSSRMQFANSATGSTSSDGFIIGLAYSEHADIMLNEPSKSIRFKTNGDNTRMVITDAGLIGIGTSSPSHPLHIKTATTSSYLRFETNDGDTGYVGYTQDEGIKLATASGSSGVKVFIALYTSSIFVTSISCLDKHISLLLVLYC